MITTTEHLPSDGEPRKVVRAVRRGLVGRCPACGDGRLFGRFLKVAESCPDCGQAFHHHRADDFPPYLVIFAVGHLVGYGIYVSETRFEGVPLWFQALLWPSLAVGLSLALLQPVKGAVIGLQYGLGMHGFGRSPHVVAALGQPGDLWGTEEDERGQRRAAEGLVRDGRSGSALAEPAPPGRGNAHHP